MVLLYAPLGIQSFKRIHGVVREGHSVQGWAGLWQAKGLHSSPLTGLLPIPVEPAISILPLHGSF